MSNYILSTGKGTLADVEMFDFSDEGMGNESNIASGSGEVVVSASTSRIPGVRPDVLTKQGLAASATENGSNGANPQARVIRGKRTHKERQAMDQQPSVTGEPKKQRRKRKSKFTAYSWKDELEHIRAQRAIAEEHQRQQEQLQLQQQMQQLRIQQEQIQQEQIAHILWLQSQHWEPASYSSAFNSEQENTPAMFNMHDPAFDMQNTYPASIASTPYDIENQHPYHPALFEQQTTGLQPPLHTNAYELLPQLPPWDTELLYGEGEGTFTPTDFTIPDDMVPQLPYFLPDGSGPFH